MTRSLDERVANWDRTQRSLDLVAAANTRLAERAQQRSEAGSEAEERYQERMRQAEEREREKRELAAAHQRQQAKPVPAQPATMDTETARAWNAWADRKIEKLGKDLIEATLEHLQERFTKSRQLTNDRVQGVEDRLTKTEQATVELITELESRIVELEQRAVPVQPSKPRLVGGADAA